MAYRRKGRKYYGKRKGYKKKTRARYPYRKFRQSSDFHYFKQHAELPNLNVVAGTPLFFANTFKLNDLSNVTSFDSLFDHYRIVAVKITYYPPFTVYNVGGATTLNAPEIYLVKDYDSAVPLTTVGQLDSYTHCKHRMFTRPVSMYVKPKVTMPVYNSGNNAFCNPTKSPWIDMANLDVVYYGILGAITCSLQTNLPALTVRVTADYYIQCKNVR